MGVRFLKQSSMWLAVYRQGMGGNQTVVVNEGGIEIPRKGGLFNLKPMHRVHNLSSSARKRVVS